MQTERFLQYIWYVFWGSVIYKSDRNVILIFQSFLYIAWYFTWSCLGNLNYFFFAAHLLDVAISFNTLRTIMQSVTHNGKQVHQPHSSSFHYTLFSTSYCSFHISLSFFILCYFQLKLSWCMSRFFMYSVTKFQLDSTKNEKFPHRPPCKNHPFW